MAKLLLQGADRVQLTYSVNYVDIDIAASVGVGILMVEWETVLVNPVQCPGGIILNVCRGDPPILVH